MLLNITIASLMMMGTTAVHAGGISLVVFFVKTHEKHWGPRHSFVRMRVISSVVLLMFFLSLIEILAWALVYLYVGAIGNLEKALYFSTVTFTTLGYGDILLDSNWRLMAAFEAANGIIIFGLSTAVVVAAVHRVYFPNSPPTDSRATGIQPGENL